MNLFSKINKTGVNIILTGIPRSGTTLACRLLTDYTQTIALNEPMDRSYFSSPENAKINISKQFDVFRKSLLHDGTALARTRDGKITDNAFNPDSTIRERVVERSSISFNKKLELDFTLVMKHCAEFSLLLPELAQHYQTFALIRNPLAILSSWTSVNVPVSRGKVAKSEKLNPKFHQQLNDIGDDLLTRQLFILSWYFGQYNSFEKEHILRYEDMISDPDKVLSPIAKGKNTNESNSLSNKNASKNYNKSKVKLLGDALLESKGNYWNYYSQKDVMILLEQIESNEQ